MNWLSFLTSAARLFTSVFNAIREWTIAALGRAKGRAESDADHAVVAKEADEAMQAIARKPLTREEIEKKLEEGRA